MNINKSRRKVYLKLERRYRTQRRKYNGNFIRLLLMWNNACKRHKYFHFFKPRKYVKQ